jgi:hypothetical protein
VWLLVVTQGRRDIVYPALIVIALARYAGYRWSELSFRKILLIGLSFSFLFIGVLTYQLFRLAGGRVSSTKLSAEAKQAQKWAENGEAWKITTSSSSKNVERRTLDVTFLANILYHERTIAPAFGKDLLLQIDWIIPSAIYPSKPTYQEEEVASRTFHVFYTDQPNSLFTAGALDFGIWGVMVYPIIAVFLLSFFLRCGLACFSYEVVIFGVILFVSTTIAAEQQMAGYFEPLRDLLVFAPYLYLVSKIPTTTKAAGIGDIGRTTSDAI